MRYRQLRYRHSIVATVDPLGPLEMAAWRGVLAASPCFRPDADVCETPSSVVVTIDIAGVAEDELEVLLFDDALVVEGQRRLACEDACGVYHAAAIRQGPFRVELALPAAVDPARVTARYVDGLLRITLAKTAEQGAP